MSFICGADVGRATATLSAAFQAAVAAVLASKIYAFLAERQPVFSDTAKRPLRSR